MRVFDALALSLVLDALQIGLKIFIVQRVPLWSFSWLEHELELLEQTALSVKRGWRAIDSDIDQGLAHYVHVGVLIRTTAAMTRCVGAIRF